MSATSAPSAEFQDGGKPVAFPLYLVDTSGNPISSTNSLPVNVSLSATSVAIEDGTTASQKLAVDAGGRITSIIEAVAGTALAADQTNSELRVSAYGKQTTAGDTPLLVDASGRLYVNVNSLPALAAGSSLIGGVNVVDSAGTNKLAVDSSGRLTLIPNTSVNAAQIGGQAPTLDNTTVLATSMRVKTTVAGDTALAVGQATMANSLPVTVASNQTPLTSGTGTKSNVGSSASSVTILASNANRKGAVIYNDSTQVLYLDLTGGTATNASYSVQVPSNGYFELPGIVIYTGAITGIWAAVNGNARVTEWT